MSFNRRSFIALAAGGTAGAVCTPMVWNTVRDFTFWTQNWPWVHKLKYGEQEQVSAICKFGGVVYGSLVTTVAGNPVTAHGNPNNPLSLGGICALGAANVQMMYSPSRIKSPMKKNGDKFESISWEDALKLLAEKIKSAGKETAAVSGDETGSVSEILGALINASGSKDMFYMPNDGLAFSNALKHLLGASGQVGYDIENADYVFSLGANIFEASGANVRNARAFSASRTNGSSYIYAGCSKEGIGAVADEWIPCLPGKEYFLVLGVINDLMTRKNLPPVQGFDYFKEFVLKNYSLDTVSKETGVDKKIIQKISNNLLKAKSPLVMLGSSSGTGLGVLEAGAGIALNILLGRVNVKGGMQLLPFSQPVVTGALDGDNVRLASLPAYLADIADDKKKAPKLLLVHEANPAYALPENDKINKALKKCEFIVSFSTYLDETAAKADLLLPNAHILERADDVYTPYGAASIIYFANKALVKPTYDVKSTGDVLLTLANSLGYKLGFATVMDVLKAKSIKMGEKDFVSGKVITKTETVSQKMALQIQLTTRAEKIDEAYPLLLAPITQLRIGNAATAISPFAVTTIYDDEYKKSAGSFFVFMNSATAKKANVFANSKIKISSAVGECRARVTIDENVMTGVIVAPLGFGHTAWDEFSRGKGQNIYGLLPMEVEAFGTIIANVAKVKIQVV